MLTLLVLRVSLSRLLRAGPARLATMQCGCSPTNIDWLAAGERVGIADVFTSCLHLGCEPTELTCAPVADDPFIYAIHFARLCLVDVACATGPRRKAFICVCAVRCGTCYTPLPVLGIGTGSTAAVPRQRFLSQFPWRTVPRYPGTDDERLRIGWQVRTTVSDASTPTDRSNPGGERRWFVLT